MSFHGEAACYKWKATWYLSGCLRKNRPVMKQWNVCIKILVRGGEPAVGQKQVQLLFSDKTHPHCSANCLKMALWLSGWNPEVILIFSYCFAYCTSQTLQRWKKGAHCAKRNSKFRVGWNPLIPTIVIYSGNVRRRRWHQVMWLRSDLETLKVVESPPICTY